MFFFYILGVYSVCAIYLKIQLLLHCVELDVQTHTTPERTRYTCSDVFVNRITHAKSLSTI